MGHLSPLAAYDRGADTVLVLDTASYKCPPTWVPLSKLYEAVKTTDGASGRTRGYVEISAAVG